MIFQYLLILSILFPGIRHPVHVSVTSIEYNRDEELFAVAFRIFTDDLETILADKYGVQLTLGSGEEPEVQREYFNRYISASFTFAVNEERELTPRFEMKKMDEEATWLYYTYECIDRVNSAHIRNSILLDLYKDQTNLLIFKYLEFENGYQFNILKQEVVIGLLP